MDSPSSLYALKSLPIDGYLSRSGNLLTLPAQSTLDTAPTTSACVIRIPIGEGELGLSSTLCLNTPYYWCPSVSIPTLGDHVAERYLLSSTLRRPLPEITVAARYPSAVGQNLVSRPILLCFRRYMIDSIVLFSEMPSISSSYAIDNMNESCFQCG